MIFPIYIHLGKKKHSYAVIIKSVNMFFPERCRYIVTVVWMSVTNFINNFFSGFRLFFSA